MNQQTTFQRIIHFFLTKIIIGIAVVGGSVALTEFAGRRILELTTLTNDSKNYIISVSEAVLALVSYIFLFRFYEKRQVKELRVSTVVTNAVTGFTTGLTLQSLFILVIYVMGHYSILYINPVTFVIPGFMAALTAGFVAELLLCGIIFRLTEEKLGTVIALIISTLIFAIAHGSVEGATFISICATTVQAAIMLNAAYIFSRSLWLPIFLHFSWDFAEPAIYGAVNPGISVLKSLFESKITGPAILSGGQFGPQNSIQSFVLCSITAFIFLRLAKQKNNFIKPYWIK